ncbi:MAG: WxcM-like domain-containing protein [Patescibacteria group bacterium]
MPIKVTKIRPEFVDKRGFISRIIDQKKIPIRSVLIITSKAKSVRGDHYHKKDSHYIYCLSGKFKYSSRDLKSSYKKNDSVILRPGDLVLTKPMNWHSMEFLEDTVFLAFTTETREHGKYEADTVRSKSL